MGTAISYSLEIHAQCLRVKFFNTQLNITQNVKCKITFCKMLRVYSYFLFT